MNFTRRQLALLVSLTLIWGLNWPVMKVAISGWPDAPDPYPPRPSLPEEGDAGEGTSLPTSPASETPARTTPSFAPILERSFLN